MNLAFAIGLTGVATLVAAVLDALYMMRLRRVTGNQPALREIVQLAIGANEPEAGILRLARFALAARLASFGGIGVLVVLLAKL